MKDLLARLDSILAEGSVAPGEKKALSFKLNKLEKMKEKIQKYQHSFSSMKNISLPAELQKEQNQLAEKIAIFTEKLEREYNELNKRLIGKGDTPIKLENLLKGIKKNCSQILKVYQQINNKDLTSNNFLFRGIRSQKDAFYGTPYTNRLPKDSDEFINKLADDYMKRMGIKARRSNSIFATGDRKQASKYGEEYIIFPVDGFDFCYSKNIKDLILSDFNYLTTFLNSDVVTEIIEIVRKTWKEASEGDKIKQEFDDITSINLLLTDTSYSHNKDMRKLAKLVEKGVLPKKVGSLLEQIYNEDNKPKQKFNFVDNDIYGAILSKNEIYINSKYYAINAKYTKSICKFISDLDLTDVELPEKYGKLTKELKFINDIVKIVNGSDSGKIGIVYEVSNQQANVKTSFDGNIIFDIPFDDLEVIDKNQWKWKKGDKVIPTSKNSALRGYEGEVIEIKDNESIVGVKFDKPNDKSYYFYNFELVKSTPETKKKYEELKISMFQVNDRVVIIDPDSPFYQLTGTIVYVFTYDTVSYDVRIDKSFINFIFKPTQIGFKSENKDKIKEPIASGDTVLIKKEGSEYDGKIGVIISVQNSGQAGVQLVGENTKYQYISLKHLFKHNQEATHNKIDIVVGSVVKVIKGGATGSRGVVIDKEDDDIIIQFYTGNTLKTTVYDVEPKIIKDSKGTAINIGDKVIVNNDELGSDDGNLVVRGFTYTKDDNLAVFAVELYTESGKTIIATPNDITIESTKKFKIGDKVKIISGGLTGFEGEVVDNDGSFIKVSTPQGVLAYKEKELELVANNGKKEDPEEASNTFNPVEGDKVELIKSVHDAAKGTKGTIEYISTFDLIYIKVEGTSKIITVPDKSYLKKIDSFSKDKFKVGDKVKVVDPSHKFYGKEGYIDFVWVDGNFDVKEKTSQVEFYVTKDQIEKIKTKEPIPGQKFQIGDTVKVIEPDSVYFGKIGKVTFIPKKELGYGVKFSDAHSDIHFDQDELELVVKQKNDFKYGDIVEFNKSPIVANGTLGMVTNSDPLLVKILEGDKFGKEFSFDTTQLSKIPMYKVGEKIEVINPKLSLFGKTGVIVDTKNSMLYVKLIGTKDTIIFNNTSVKRIPDKDIPQPIHADKIQVGDKVKVKSSWSKLFGKIGIVQAVGDTFADVVIPPDGPENPTTIELSSLTKIETNTSINPTFSKIEIGDIVEVDIVKYPQYAGKKYKVKHMTKDREVLLVYDLSDQAKNLITVGADEVKKLS